MNLKPRKIPFSPPDMSEREVEMAAEAIRSGWITTGPKTKEFEKRLASYISTRKVVCLNSATAALEMVLRLIGVGPDDEVIVPVDEPTKTGYTFSGWTAIPETMPVGGVTVYGTFAADEFTVTYLDYMGVIIADYTAVYSYGDTIDDVPAGPAVEGKEFLGWTYKTELADGIKLAYEDFLNNPMRAER